jgi:5-methylcytosine-specific restriction endonuclease McrA
MSPLTLVLIVNMIAGAGVPQARDERPHVEAERRREARDTRRARCEDCTRKPSGRISRSSSARRAFRELHPCPATGRSSGACPGYEIDHVRPLHQGGADTPDNMQWLTHEAHAAKTARESERFR